MNEPTNDSLARLIRQLENMKAGRNGPAAIDQAHLSLREAGYIAEEIRSRVQVKTEDEDLGSTARLVEKPVEAIIKYCEAVQATADVAKGKSESTARHGLGHAERFFIASVFRKLPGGVEAIHDFINECSDYDQEITDYQIDSLDHGPLLCRTAQEYGICWHDESCPSIKTRVGKSPVAFAYRTPRKGEARQKRGVEKRRRNRNLSKVSGKSVNAPNGMPVPRDALEHDPQKWLSKVRHVLGGRKE